MHPAPHPDETYLRRAFQTMTNGGTAAFHTLGCKLNFSETSTLARLLDEAGFARVSVDDRPDVVVINTCSVTDHADAKCRNAVRRARTANPEAFVAVVGCYAQLKPEEIASIPGVDLVLGASEKFNLVQHLGTRGVHVGEIKEVRTFVPGFSSGDRTRTFLKVQDGCNYFCAFCTIPLARGRSRSASVEATVAQAREAAALGAKEIVLTGVNIGDFGREGGESLEDLVRALDALESIDRFRISSIEPDLLTDSLIDFVAESRAFMPHFHLPLQSGSDRILAAMRRRYRTDRYRSRVDRIRERMPEAAIGCDVISGFPGEGAPEFQETLDFLHATDVTYLHAFTYSEREKTTALRLADVVPVPERQERTRILRQLSLKKQRAHWEQFVGSVRPVLFEHAEEEGLRFGFTPEYVRIAAPAEAVLPNTLTSVRLDTVHAAGHVSCSLQT
jgi:threonylcarbamoyladenosine tRNA methylthiotransferase MtaB